LGVVAARLQSSRTITPQIGHSMYPSQPTPDFDRTTYNSIPPKNNIGWADAAIVFFWPVAFSAFTHSNNVYRLWSIGDLAGAQYASDRAKRLGQISILVSLVLSVLYVVFLFVWMTSLLGSMNSY
jgi:hypothetical protein